MCVCVCVCVFVCVCVYSCGLWGVCPGCYSGRRLNAHPAPTSPCAVPDAAPLQPPPPLATPLVDAPLNLGVNTLFALLFGGDSNFMAEFWEAEVRLGGIWALVGPFWQQAREEAFSTSGGKKAKCRDCNVRW